MNTRQIGNASEEYACRYLTRRNYRILARNWRYRRAEIDIIALHKAILVFIEVKSRYWINFGEAEIAVNSHKEKLLFAAAQAFMEKNNYDWAIRFDIISIELDSQKRVHRLKHILDVFF